MVSFICDACGNTVKKTQVEKHYTTACRNCSVLSCLDCGVDFPGDTYLNHTSCVTEAEKYQGHLYQAKDKENKGETKQKEWLKNVHGTSGQTADPKLRSLLKKLSAYSNIPRKKKKFDNFCKNSVNVYDAKTLDQLWDLFTGGNDANAGKPAGASQGGTACVENGTVCVENGTENGKAENGKAENDTECEENKESEEELSIPDVAVEPKATTDTEPSTRKKKKKKNKQLECETFAVKENVENGCVTEEGGEETVTKKKKKKKNKIAVCNGDSLQEVAEVVTNEEPLVEPKKKKKKKGKEVTTEILVESQQLTKKSKKSKKKHDVNETDNMDPLSNDETERKLGKKSKLKDAAAEPECNLNKKLKIDGENGEGDEEEPAPGGKFNWHRTIKQILKESEDGELSLKKLQKKVLSAYQAHGLDHRASTVNEAMALCDKKIKSYPKAKIIKDRVKLTK